jgi:hypothetical protein
MNSDYATATNLPELRQTLAAVERALEGWVGRGEFGPDALAEMLCDLVALKSLGDAGDEFGWESRYGAPGTDIQVQ